jgi:hypothetical protein
MITKRIWLLLALLRSMWPAHDPDLRKQRKRFIWRIRLIKSANRK